ncbi:MAG: lytic transglycosylase domain-containing protein, partial [Proteobacteria bacterium]|nr:lytic transglycosylase domain-containing protein [Pseudomonadota bacterium]
NLGSRAGDQGLSEVLSGIYLGQDGSDATFAVYQQFLQAHPTWPDSVLKPIARQAEQHMDAGLPATDVLAFFAQYPAQSDEGFRRYIAALSLQNRASEAKQAIRQRWRETAMGDREEDSFLRSFHALITGADTAARLDRFLWDGKYDQARTLYPHLSPGMKKLAQARIALAEGGGKKALRALRAVPAALQGDRGLLYDRIKLRFKEDDTEGAVAMITRAGAPPSHKDAWWNLRQRAARELLQNGQYRRAYSLAKNHGLSEGQPFAEAEFLSGWIALRFLNEPSVALDHFTRIYEQSSSPITLSRAAYWSARAYEQLNDGPHARSWYGRALVYGTSYYGQLAAARLYRESRISVPEAAISDAARERFENAAETSIITGLYQAGQTDLAQSFAIALARGFTQEQEFRLLCGLATTLDHGELAVRVSKEAAKKKILLPGEGYPLLSYAENLPEEQAALVHALIRQESEFDSRAVSSSNAQGLMQMLPSTAKHVAKQNNFDDNPDLFDPATSVRFGTAYVNELQSDFGGYLPMVIASYNAGPNAVRGWLSKMGDPRAGQIDVLDWIESIPYAETRNYVQRVLEGLQVYRARLSGGSTMLALENDLRVR